MTWFGRGGASQVVFPPGAANSAFGAFSPNYRSYHGHPNSAGSSTTTPAQSTTQQPKHALETLDEAFDRAVEERLLEIRPLPAVMVPLTQRPQVVVNGKVYQPQHVGVSSDPGSIHDCHIRNQAAR